MKCNELLAEHSRCKRGIPVGHLFRHYFCEGRHQRCPLKRMGKAGKQSVAGLPADMVMNRGEA